jgi:branched-chain amino acid transport system substrate-binding protein
MLRGVEETTRRIKTLSTRNRFLAGSLLAAALFLMPVADGRAAETSIKIGNTAPYSGPASAYGTIARAEAAYFQMLNDQGGINGRRIDFLTLDDAYSPAKTVEQTRKLVEQDEVLAMFSAVGTAPNISVQKYLNAKRIPQLFVSTGATRWNDPEHFPWTVGFNPTYEQEGRLYAQFILQTKPDARIAVITPNEDAGKDYLRGFKAGLGEQVGQLVSETTYLTADPTIDFADGQDAGVRRRRFLRRSDAQICRPGHQESRQHGLETADHPAGSFQLLLRGARTGGAGK